MIGISPMEFWELSPTEVYSAIKGWSEFNTSESEEGPMTRDELTELMELYPD